MATNSDLAPIHHTSIYRLLEEHLTYNGPSGVEFYKPLPPRANLQALLYDLLRLGPRLECYPIYLSDTYFLLGDVASALECYPIPVIGRRQSELSSWRLNLKLLTGQACAARELLALFDPNLTRFGRDHLELVETYLDKLLEIWAVDHGEDVLAYIARKHPEYRRRRHGFYSGSFINMYWTEPVHFSFYEVVPLEQMAKKLAREAENTVRDEMEMPRVGEGWVSETQLWRLVREWLAPMEVVHHARFPWLGRMHLDIYVPSLRLAIEYQGRQHQEPVAYFGGEEAYQQVVKRDKRKKSLCTRHGVQLVRVYEGYDPEEVERLVRSFVPSDAGRN